MAKIKSNSKYCYIITFSEIETIQKLTRRALDMTWRNSLSHDCISPDKAKTFPLMEYYTDLRWTRTVKRALQNSQERLSSIFDILSLPRAGEEPTNVLVEGNFRKSYSDMNYNSVASSLCVIVIK